MRREPADRTVTDKARNVLRTRLKSVLTKLVDYFVHHLPTGISMRV